MSSIKLESNASGTGIFTIASPNSNTNRTLTLPDNTGTILTSASTTVYPKGGPAFSAYQSSVQTLSSATWTKINLQTEEFDTASCFDSTTNYRFTPNVAGYYQINGSVTGSVTATTAIANIYKNGSQAKWGSYTGSASNSSVVSALIYLNGSTDYIELYGFLTVGQALAANAGQTYFQAFLARAD